MMVTRRRLAQRRLDHEWPAEVQQLWHAAQQLRLAVDTLEVGGYLIPLQQSTEVWAEKRARYQAAEDFAMAALERVEELARGMLDD